MDRWIESPISAAIYIPLLKDVSSDRSANHHMQFSTPHSEVTLNNLRPADARVNDEYKVDLSIPVLV